MVAKLYSYTYTNDNVKACVLLSITGILTTVIYILYILIYYNGKPIKYLKSFSKKFF